MNSLRAGTRGSALALWQTTEARRVLGETWPGLEVEPLVITTRGDVDPADRLVGRLDKGFFTEELEAGLRRGELDLAIHSLKDLPTVSPEGLVIGAVLPRASAEDWLIVRPEALAQAPPASLPLGPGARVGTSAVRRASLMQRYAPHVTTIPLRGNVPTRLVRLREGRYEAIVMASAGVSRLGLDLSGLAAFVLDPDRWIPAPGQGTIAIQCRADDAETLALLAGVNHPPTARAVAFERALLRASEGGCASAFGARVAGGRVVWGLEEAGRWRRLWAPLEEDAPESRASELFHTKGIPWEDEDNAPLHRPI